MGGESFVTEEVISCVNHNTKRQHIQCVDWPFGWHGSNDVVNRCNENLKTKYPDVYSKHNLEYHMTGIWGSHQIWGQTDWTDDGCYNKMPKYKDNFKINRSRSCTKGGGGKSVHHVECNDWPGGWLESDDLKGACQYALNEEKKGDSTIPSSLEFTQTGQVIWQEWPDDGAKDCWNVENPGHFVIKDDGAYCDGDQLKGKIECTNWPGGWLPSVDTHGACNYALRQAKEKKGSTIPANTGGADSVFAQEGVYYVSRPVIDPKGCANRWANTHKATTCKTKTPAATKTYPNPVPYAVTENEYHCNNWPWGWVLSDDVINKCNDSFDKLKMKTSLNPSQPQIPADAKYSRYGISQQVISTFETPNDDGGCWNKEHPDRFKITDIGDKCEKGTGATIKQYECTDWPAGWTPSDDVVAACNYALKDHLKDTPHLHIAPYTKKNWEGFTLIANVKTKESGCWNTKYPDNFTNTYRGEECKHGDPDGIHKYECDDWPGGWEMSPDVIAACDYSLDELRKTKFNIPSNAHYNPREPSADPDAAGSAIGTSAYAEFKPLTPDQMKAAAAKVAAEAAKEKAYAAMEATAPKGEGCHLHFSEPCNQQLHGSPIATDVHGWYTGTFNVDHSTKDAQGHPGGTNTSASCTNRADVSFKGGPHGWCKGSSENLVVTPQWGGPAMTAKEKAYAVLEATAPKEQGCHLHFSEPCKEQLNGSPIPTNVHGWYTDTFNVDHSTKDAQGHSGGTNTSASCTNRADMSFKGGPHGWCKGSSENLVVTSHWGGPVLTAKENAIAAELALNEKILKAAPKEVGCHLYFSEPCMRKGEPNGISVPKGWTTSGQTSATSCAHRAKTSFLGGNGWCNGMTKGPEVLSHFVI